MPQNVTVRMAAVHGVQRLATWPNKPWVKFRNRPVLVAGQQVLPSAVRTCEEDDEEIQLATVGGHRQDASGTARLTDASGPSPETPAVCLPAVCLKGDAHGTWWP